MSLAYIATITATFIVLDSIYFTVNNTFLKKTIQSVQKSSIKINYIGVFLTYVFMVAMEYCFIIMQNRTVIDAFLLGIGIYGIYELTNFATLVNWPFSMVIMDTIWGGILFASATCVIRYVLKLKM